MIAKAFTHAREAIKDLIAPKLMPAYSMALGDYDDHQHYYYIHVRPILMEE